MNFWFISDTHFGHENIIKYCNRPFKDADEMNETIINNWNERVDKEDTVFHLGDLCFKKMHRGENIVARLNGNIILIKGNHDHKQAIKTITEAIVIYHCGHYIYLTHRPENADPLRISLVGHAHEKWKIDCKKNFPIVNVGVDVWDFKPISLDEILVYIKEDK